jgi:hypothetical protein
VVADNLVSDISAKDNPVVIKDGLCDTLIDDILDAVGGKVDLDLFHCFEKLDERFAL